MENSLQSLPSGQLGQVGTPVRSNTIQDWNMQ